MGIIISEDECIRIQLSLLSHSHPFILTQQQQASQPPIMVEDVEEVFKDFPTYNREYERRRLMLEEKEQMWEAELKQLMEQSS